MISPHNSGRADLSATAATIAPPQHTMFQLLSAFVQAEPPRSDSSAGIKPCRTIAAIDRLQLAGRHGFAQPVASERDRRHHLRGVDEMGAVPVGKAGGRLEFGQKPLPVPLVAVQKPRDTQCVNAFGESRGKRRA